MWPVSETFLATLRRSHKSAARVSVLDPVSFSVLAELSGVNGYAIGGSVTMDRNRAIRRTMSLSLANPGGVWTPNYSGDPANPGSFFFFNSLLRLERGIYLSDDQVEWAVLGHFLVDSPTVDVSPDGSTLTVNGQDRLKLLARSKWTTPATYASGTRIQTVVQTEAQAAGMGTVAYRLDDGGDTLAVARTFEEGEDRLEGLTNLARDYGLELYVAADGFLTLAPPPDPLTAPVAYTFSSGEEAIHLGVTKEWTDDRLYNHVVVTGEAAGDDPIIRAEASDLNPASPAYIYGPLGDRVYRYTSAMITTQAQADAVAANLLREVALIEEALQVPTVVNPALEPGDAIVLVDSASKTDGRYLLDSIQLPLVLGTQSLGAKVVRSLV